MIEFFIVLALFSIIALFAYHFNKERKEVMIDE